MLDKTGHHNEELERFKLQMMIKDNNHRKNLMLLRVAGLQHIAPHFKYFQSALRKTKSTDPRPKKLSLKDRIIYKAMILKEYN